MAATAAWGTLSLFSGSASGATALLCNLTHRLTLGFVQFSIAIGIKPLDHLFASGTLCSFPVLGMLSTGSTQGFPFLLVQFAVAIEVKAFQDLLTLGFAVRALLALLALLLGGTLLETLTAWALLLGAQFVCACTAKKEEDTKEFDVHGLGELPSQDIQPQSDAWVPNQIVGTSRPILAESPWI